MTTTNLICWNCGRELPDVPLPVGRGEECPECVAAVRACRMCRFYDPNVSNDCREPMADVVADKERANTCDYFSPASAGKERDEGEAGEARAKLEALFGSSAERKSSLADEAASFGESGRSEAEQSRRRLEEAFGKKDE